MIHYNHYLSSSLGLLIIIYLNTAMMIRSYSSFRYFISNPRKCQQNQKIFTKQPIITQTLRMITTDRKTFWDGLGRPRFIAAPMVDHSGLAFRLLVRSNGCDLAFTQMLSSKIYSRDAKYRKENSDWFNYRDNMNSSGLSEDQLNDAEQFAVKYDRPLIVQFNGNDPQNLVNSGKFIDKTVSAIDLNLGCPQGIARKGNYGAYLLNTKDKTIIFNIIKAMVRDLACPVTVKIRKLSTGKDEDTVRFCQELEDCGASMITVHGRLLEQSKLFTGPADWNIIKKVKAGVRSIPIVANGGIYTYDDCIRCLEETGVDAVMSSEALLENPKLFSESHRLQYEENFIATQLQTVDEYIQLVLRYTQGPGAQISALRGHLFKMLHRFVQAEKNADIRQQLALGDPSEMIHSFEVLKERCYKYAKQGGKESFEQAKRDGYCIETDWYMRHRDERAQRRVLSLPKRGLPYVIEKTTPTKGLELVI